MSAPFVDVVQLLSWYFRERERGDGPPAMDPAKDQVSGLQHDSTERLYWRAKISAWLSTQRVVGIEELSMLCDVLGPQGRSLNALARESGVKRTTLQRRFSAALDRLEALAGLLGWISERRPRNVSSARTARTARAEESWATYGNHTVH